jgi:hypothetical protein
MLISAFAFTPGQTGGARSWPVPVMYAGSLSLCHYVTSSAITPNEKLILDQDLLNGIHGIRFKYEESNKDLEEWCLLGCYAVWLL